MRMRFKRIYIEITNACNLTCSFCIQNHRAIKQMSVDEFTHVAKQIHGYTTYVYLHILGEPLVHPQLAAILQICNEYHLQVNLTTNGTLLLDKKDILLQASSLRQVNISLHSFPQHEQQAYLQDVFTTGEVLSTKQIHVNYRLWSIHQGMLTEATKEVLHVLEERYQLTLDDEQIKRLTRITLKDYIYLHLEEIFEWPSLQQPYIGDKGTCLGMKHMCGILSNGDIVPCCLDSKGECALGNIFTDSFENVIQGKRADHMVRGFSQRSVKEALCQHCRYRLRFQ